MTLLVSQMFPFNESISIIHKVAVMSHRQPPFHWQESSTESLSIFKKTESQKVEEIIRTDS